MNRQVRPSPFLLRPTPGVSIDHGGRRLLGGSPQRLVTLSPEGAELVAGWFDGKPVGHGSAHRALACRLVEADIATAEAGQPSAATSLIVVIPVKDDPDGLAATLASLEAAPTPVDQDTSDGNAVHRIVVVDDGSRPAVDPAVGKDVGVPVTVVRRSVSAGPGNARNLGGGHGDEQATVFVDAGVIVTMEQLQALSVELTVGDTVAVAPRVRSEDRPGRLARYERMWSPLDLGSDAGIVGPGRRLSYVPSTCLAVNTSALRACGGFDPDLRFGEDVDLVWRLGSQGWVRYVPGIEVTHPPRSSIAGFIRQRYRYGTAAGPLARRHGRAVAPARLDSRSAVAWTALATGFRPLAGLVAASSTVAYLATVIHHGLPPRRAVRLVTAGWVGTGRGLALSTARTWWPLALVAATRSRFRPAFRLLALGWLRRLRWRQRRRPTPDGHRTSVCRTFRDAGLDIALGAIDDSAYALGVWRGAAGARTAVPLLPDVAIGRSPTER